MATWTVKTADKKSVEDSYKAWESEGWIWGKLNIEPAQ